MAWQQNLSLYLCEHQSPEYRNCLNHSLREKTTLNITDSQIDCEDVECWTIDGCLSATNVFCLQCSYWHLHDKWKTHYVTELKVFVFIFYRE